MIKFGRHLVVFDSETFSSWQSYDPEDGYNDGQGPLVGSFPKDFGYGPDEHDDEVPGGTTAENKPRILLMGLRR